jgi:hypothetical protein
MNEPILSFKSININGYITIDEVYKDVLRNEF